MSGAGSKFPRVTGSENSDGMDGFQPGGARAHIHVPPSAMPESQYRDFIRHLLDPETQAKVKRIPPGEKRRAFMRSVTRTFSRRRTPMERFRAGRPAPAPGRTRCHARVRTASRTGTGGDPDSGGDPADSHLPRVEQRPFSGWLRTTPHHISRNRCHAPAWFPTLGEQHD